MYDVEDESLPYIIGSGSIALYTPRPPKDPPLKKDQIGFIRKKKNVPKSKVASKSTTPRERPAKKGTPKKGADSKRAARPVRKQSGTRAIGFRARY